MKLFVIYGVLTTFLLLPAILKAQEEAPLLTYEQFLQQVYTLHPIAKQANLMQEKAVLALKGARGGFDPKLGTNWDYKHFDKKAYYNILNAHLKVPTWIGLEVEAGYNHANGYYLNPENKLPDAGQAYLSLKMPLLKGLWTDERRTAIQQAKVLQESSAAEIQLALNDLLYQAAQAYWEWTKAHNNQDVVVQALSIAKKQLNITEQSFLQGALPAIDTLKAFLLVQERQLLLSEMNLLEQNSRRNLSTFLWDAGEQPLSLPPNTRPVPLDQLSHDNLAPSILENSLSQLEGHPNLQLYDFKLQNLALERRLKSNKLLPSLYFKYNFLSANHVNFFDGVSAAAPVENFKLGVTFSMPIFLRKERADLELTKLKIREVNYLQQSKRQNLRIKIENYFNTIQIAAQQVDQLKQMVANYTTLLESEQLKLDLGESGVFMVNTRENQLLEANLKLVKQQIEYLKSKSTFFWITAALPLNMK